MDFTILHFAIHIVWRANVICTCRKSGIARKTTVAYPELRFIDYNDGTVVNAAKTGYFADPAGISNVNTNGNFEIKAIYDVSGRKLDAMQKGLNIVKTVDGKTTKIFMK